MGKENGAGQTAPFFLSIFPLKPSTLHPADSTGARGGIKGSKKSLHTPLQFSADYAILLSESGGWASAWQPKERTENEKDSISDYQGNRG